MSDISKALHDLIIQNFDSVESVEIVLLLRRAPDTYWTPEAASERLGIRADIASRKMQALAAAKILVTAQQTTAYRYAPSDETTASRISELADLYADRRITVINAIYSANLERLRTFSNAFKLSRS